MAFFSECPSAGTLPDTRSKASRYGHESQRRRSSMEMTSPHYRVHHLWFCSHFFRGSNNVQASSDFQRLTLQEKHCSYLKAGKSLLRRSVIFPQCLKSLMLPPKIFYQPNLLKEVAKVWINLLFSSSISCHTLLLRNLIFSFSGACSAASFVNHFTSSIQPF